MSFPVSFEVVCSYNRLSCRWFYNAKLILLVCLCKYFLCFRVYLIKKVFYVGLLGVVIFFIKVIIIFPVEIEELGIGCLFLEMS